MARVLAAAVALTVLLALQATFGAVRLSPADSIRYAALGDSYASGLGAGDYRQGASAESGCSRSDSAYPALWAQQHPVSSFTFLACAGATVTEVAQQQVPAIEPRTDLVTLSVGGNDIGFTQVLVTCQLGGPQQCRTAVQRAQRAANADLGERLQRIYRAIRQRAPQAELLVLGYPRLFGPESADQQECRQGRMGSAQRRALNDGAATLAGVLADAAEAAGARYIDANARFEGHRVCGPRAWLRGLSYPLRESYHPNELGQSRGLLPALTGVTRQTPLS